MKFCDKILAFRKEKGLSQEELGNILSVSRQTVSKWELGQTYPETDKLILISRHFNVSIDDILKDTDEMNSVYEKKTTDSVKIDYRKSIISIFLIVVGVIGIIILGVNSASNPHTFCSDYCYDGFFGYIYGNKLQLIFYLCYAIIVLGSGLLSLEIKNEIYKKIVLVGIIGLSFLLFLTLPITNRVPIYTSDNYEQIID